MQGADAECAQAPLCVGRAGSARWRGGAVPQQQHHAHRHRPPSKHTIAMSAPGGASGLEPTPAVAMDAVTSVLQKAGVAGATPAQQAAAAAASDPQDPQAKGDFVDSWTPLGFSEEMAQRRKLIPGARKAASPNSAAAERPVDHHAPDIGDSTSRVGANLPSSATGMAPVIAAAAAAGSGQGADHGAGNADQRATVLQPWQSLAEGEAAAVVAEVRAQLVRDPQQGCVYATAGEHADSIATVMMDSLGDGVVPTCAVQLRRCIVAARATFGPKALRRHMELHENTRVDLRFVVCALQLATALHGPASAAAFVHVVPLAMATGVDAVGLEPAPVPAIADALPWLVPPPPHPRHPGDVPTHDDMQTVALHACSKGWSGGLFAFGMHQLVALAEGRPVQFEDVQQQLRTSIPAKATVRWRVVDEQRHKDRLAVLMLFVNGVIIDKCPLCYCLLQQALLANN